MKHNKLFRHHGFTLLELLVVIAIISITLGYGIPNFRATIISNRLTASANAMVVALQIARSESIKKIKFAGVSIHTGRDGNPSPNHWIAFLESSTLPTSTPTAGTGSLIQSYEAATDVTVTATNDTPTYRSDGRLDSASAITVDFTVADVTEKRTLTIAPSGRVNVTTTP